MTIDWKALRETELRDEEDRSGRGDRRGAPDGSQETGVEMTPTL